jgi:hypothetical protein
VIVLPLLFALQQQASPIARVAITPAKPSVAAGDTLRLRAQALDANGQPVPNARITFQSMGTGFEAIVDSTGLVTTGAMGTMPIAVVALVPGTRPVINRVEVAIVAGPAARIDLAPIPTKLLAGQRLRLDASVFSGAGDTRADVVTWRSSAPSIVRAEGGVLTAAAAGRATITATAGSATRSFDVTVVAASVGSVEITPRATQARQGDVVRFSAVVKDRAGALIAGLTPTWSMSPGKGLIERDGAFVGYDAGQFVITASFGNQSADATVNLAERDVRRKATVVGTVLRKEFATSEVWVHPNGRVAYLGTHFGGDRFYAIDISDPAKPTIVDSLVDNFRVTNDIMTTADGKWLVYSRENADDRKNGIGIADVSDPLHPKKIADFTDGVTSGVHSAFVFTQPKHGTHVYLTNDGTGELDIVDINDPYHPKKVGEWRTPRKFEGARVLHDIDVQDGLLYASWWNDGLVILDVGNGVKGGSPSNPVLVSQFKYDLEKLYEQVGIQSGPGFIRGTHTAWRHKNYVIIADEVFGLDAAQQLFSKRPAQAFGRLQVIDVSDVANPKSVAHYEPEYGGVHNVWVTGDTLYMGAYNAGFRAFDISGELRGDLRAQGREIAAVYPSSPDGWIPNTTMTWGVVVKNNLAFINDINSGLWIVRLEKKPDVVP